MATVDVYNKLSKAAKEEISRIVENRENAIDMIINNFYRGDVEYSSYDVCTRFQVQNFALNPDENTLQSNDKEGWWQNEAYEPSSVNDGIIPLMEVEATVDTWPKQYYSSFALKELPNRYTLRYPLDDDYTTTRQPFAGLSMSDANYIVAVNKIQKKLGIKIVNGKCSTINLYKRSFVNLAVTKIKNIGLKLIGKPELAKTAFKGRLVLADRTQNRYTYSNIEKIVKIYDELFRVEIAKLAKYSKGKHKVGKDIKFASRLFADILMARITDYGDTNINKKVEKCLSLQFANVLNRYPLDPEELKLVTDMASEIVVGTCARLGITKNNIIQRMTINGYQYPKVPQDEKEALLLARERDYSVYGSIAAGKAMVPVKTAEEVKSQRPGILQLQAAKVKEPDETTGKKDGVIQLGAPKIAGLLPQRASESKYSDVKRLPSLQMLTGNTIANRLLAGLAEDIKKHQTQNQPAVVVPSDDTTTIVKTRKITKKSIEKTMDKIIIKLLSEKVVSINTNLNAKRYSVVGGKEQGEQSANIYSHVLSYYTDYVNTSKKAQPESACNGTFYARTKKICNGLILLKNKLIDRILEGNESIENTTGQTSAKFLNERMRGITISDDVPQGYTIREFFKAYLKKLPKVYADLEKIDEETKQ